MCLRGRRTRQCGGTVLLGDVRSCTVERCHSEPDGALRCYTELCGSIRNRTTEPHGAMRSSTKSCGAVRSRIEPFGAAWSRTEPRGAVRSRVEPFGAVRSRTVLLGSVGGGEQRPEVASRCAASLLRAAAATISALRPIQYDTALLQAGLGRAAAHLRRGRGGE